jgi:hypothetical protein
LANSSHRECHEVGKVMHRDVEIIGPKESLRNAAAMMKKLDAGVLPVDEMTSWSA